MPTCPACGEANPEVARFCLACGVRLAAAPVTAEERRVVSVIFVDLVGFTSRAERLDPEDVQAILSLYYERVRADIESFGGVVEKFIGDAVMGLFGAPTSFGDDPERAVRAALAVCDSVRDLNAQHAGLDLQTRIAVNTGEALVRLAAGHGQAMVAGDVVNTASRLQQAAPVNGVLVGADTYACTRNVVTYEFVEPVQAKGKAAPVVAWRAVRVNCAPGDAAPSGAPLVARTRELRILGEAWDRAVADRTPQLVTVLGPAGIGKTRLGQEFARSVPGAGGRCVRGRSLPYRESSAYGAFSSQVKQLADIFENDPAELALEKLAKTVGKWLEGSQADTVTAHLGVLLGLDTRGDVPDRESLFFSVRCFIEAVAQDEPLLLVFEDLHWADPGLLDLVEWLAMRLHELPVLLLALARPELLDARRSWGSGVPSYLSLSLGPLQERDATVLAGYLLAALDAAQRDARAAELVQRTEGNPLFLEQLAATVTEQSALPAAALPTTIRGIVTARLDALPPDERALLLDAAVGGRVFWRGALSESSDSASLTRLLGALQSRDLIHRDLVSMIEGQEQYSFKHGLIRDVAYETLPRKRRQERHLHVAEFLERSKLTGAEAAAQLGRHWREGGRPDHAAEYFVQAAEIAGHGWAKDRAALLYGEALACLPEEDGQRRRDLLRKQAVAWQAAFHLVDVRDMGRPPPAG